MHRSVLLLLGCVVLVGLSLLLFCDYGSFACGGGGVCLWRWQQHFEQYRPKSTIMCFCVNVCASCNGPQTYEHDYTFAYCFMYAFAYYFEVDIRMRRHTNKRGKLQWLANVGCFWNSTYSCMMISFFPHPPDNPLRLVLTWISFQLWASPFHEYLMDSWFLLCSRGLPPLFG